jgi:flagellin
MNKKDNQGGKHMRINNNIMALNAHRQLGVNQANSSKSMEKLSSGMRINRAGDDAAGLAISEKMRGQIRGLKQAQRNAQDGISLIQTAEGALNEIHAILQRMRELADQASTDTNTREDRLEIQKEVTQLTREIDRIARTTQFNTMELLNGKYENMYFHIGANMDQNLAVDIADMRAEALGILGTEPPAADPVDPADPVDATVAASGDGASKISDVTIAAESELDGEYTLVISWDDTKAIATLKDFEDNVVGGPIDVNAGENTIGDIKFSIDSSQIPTQTTEDFSVTLTATAHVPGGATPSVPSTGSEPTVVASGDDADNISDVAIAAESELDGEYTLEITWDADNNKAIATLKDSNDNVVGDPIEVNAGVNTIGDITFSIASSQIPTKTEDDFSVTLTVTQPTEDETPPVDGDEPFDESTMHGINVFDRASANKALETIDKAIALVSEERSKLGAIQNRLEHTIANLGTSAENLQAAESRIRDLDMAEEIMAFTKNNILQQAATAMLAQANQQPQSVLQLLR